MTTTSPLRAEPAAAGAAAPGATGTLAAFACRPRRGQQRHTDAVARALLDTVAVTVAGVDAEPTRRLWSWLRGEQAAGPAAVWGTALQAAASQAALVNGTAAHALDWDDASPSIPMHPGAVLFPALLAQAAVTDADGPSLVAAYDVGSAVFRAVSEVLPAGPHYGRGWHITSTSGRLAAVAALAHLSGLDEPATRRALGLVASLASGSLANFGTMTKPLHAGLAARDAVMAVGLAAGGFTANDRQLEAPRGFFAMYGEPDSALAAGLPERLEFWEREWVGDWAIKRYPSCYATHRPIDGVLALREQLDDPRDVARIEVTVRSGGLRPLIDHRPTTGLEGKFSLEFTVAHALLHGRVGLTDFTDGAVHDPTIGALMDRVSVRETDRAEGSDADAAPYAVVRIVRRDASALTARVDVTYGDARNPLSEADLDAKLVDAFRAGGRPDRAARALAAVLRQSVTAATLRPLQEALRGERAEPGTGEGT